MITDCRWTRRSSVASWAGLVLLSLLGSCAPGKPIEGGLEPPTEEVLAIHVFPDSISLNSAEFQDFTAIAELTGGGNTPVSVQWTATGGTINSAGRFTAGSTDGKFQVLATHSSGKTDSATVVIRPAPSGPVLTGVTVSPSTAAVLPGDNQFFTASGQMSDGSSTTISVNWSATGGSISAGGQFVAPSTPGTYQVVAQQQGGTFADTAQVTVSVPPPTLVAVVLTPPSASLESGQSQQFSASGSLSDGSSVQIPITWIATGGTVNGAGLYTAGNTAGSFRVIARSANGLADTSTVTVTTPTIASITLTPPSVSLQSGQVQQFTASATLSNGNTQSNPSVTWTATGGAVNGSGLYTAGATAGTFRVIAASANGRADTSSITIATPTITSVTVTPPSASLSSGQTQQFTASALLSNGTTQNNPSVTWTATGGTVTTGGLYTAGSTAGSFRVIASANGHADTSAITISAATITAVTVTPPTASLQSGQTQQFTASATLSTGGTQSNPAVTWVATGGTITTGGLYTAGSTAGTFRVIASAASGPADTSVVTVTVATITAIVTSPASISLPVGQTQQFAASATLSSGGSQSNTPVTWSATGGTITTGGLYTAGSTTGSFRVIAVQQGGSLADTSAVTITAAVPSSMYFNSSESGCGTDPNVILCDDFEDGDWYTKNCDVANQSGGLLQTDGWCGTIFNDAGLRDGTGRCGNMGFHSNCTATAGLKDGTGANGHSSTTGNMADHELAGGGSDEIWVRFYTKPMTGYRFGQEKWLTFNAGGAGSGGIRWGNLMFNCGAGGTQGLTNGDMRMHFNPPQDICQRQNTGNDITWTAGNWYFTEVHFKLNTPGQSNGVFEMWVDNCGPDGTSCPATPTLRISRTDVLTDRQTGEKITTLWFETYASDPFSTGERLIDQIKVSKGGRIGFMP